MHTNLNCFIVHIFVMFTKFEHLRKRKNINNMTPKEKARELVNKFYVILMKKNYPNVAQMDAAKVCALIAVDEILKIVNEYSAKNMQKSSEVIFWEEWVFSEGVIQTEVNGEWLTTKEFDKCFPSKQPMHFYYGNPENPDKRKSFMY